MSKQFILSACTALAILGGAAAPAFAHAHPQDHPQETYYNWNTGKSVKQQADKNVPEQAVTFDGEGSAAVALGSH
jgi:hypothetical protein